VRKCPSTSVRIGVGGTACAGDVIPRRNKAGGLEHDIGVRGGQVVDERAGLRRKVLPEMRPPMLEYFPSVLSRTT
jgi:hypothetical protein